MFGESMIDPLARFRDLDEKVVALREAMAHATDAKDFLNKSEDQAVQERTIRAEVIDFLDTATRQAAVALKDLQDAKSTLRDDRIRREMLEFVEETRLAAERMIEDLKRQRRRILEKAQARLRDTRGGGSGKAPKAPTNAEPQPAKSASQRRAPNRSRDAATAGRPVLKKQTKASKASSRRSRNRTEAPPVPDQISEASQNSLRSIAQGGDDKRKKTKRKVK